MSATSPVLNPAQIEQLFNIVHGILDQNKKSLDENLAQIVDIQNTSILRLYEIVVEEWHNKQKIIDNLCHFSLTMMATVQLLWDQKSQLQSKLEAAQMFNNHLQKQMQDLTELNEIYKHQIIKTEIQIDSITEAKDRIEEFAKSQSCINFSEPVEQNVLDKKYSTCQQSQSKQLEVTGLIMIKSKIISQKDHQIEILRNDKVKLQHHLQEVIEESNLTRMELQLAEIAIKQALTYKSSYKSLLSQNPSKLSAIKQASNIHYFNGEIDCQSNMEDSFGHQQPNILGNQFSCKEDMIHFASTPCLLLNQSMQDFNIDGSIDIKQKESCMNPFKKKSNEEVDANHNKHASQKSNKEAQESCSNNFQVWRPQTHLNDGRVKDIIAKFQIKRSQIYDKEQTQESSLVSNEIPKFKKNQNQSKLKESKSQGSFKQSTISKLYSFVRNKIVRDRIKIK